MKEKSLKQTPKSNKDQAEALESLGAKVKSAQKARTPDIDEEASGWAVGINYASIFTGAVIVGGAFGYGFDYLTGTKPWGLMVGIVLGFAAGTRSVVQMAQGMMDEDEEQDLSKKDLSKKGLNKKDRGS